QASAQQPLPGDEHVRPAPPRVRLERHVEQPDERRPETRVGQDLDDDPQLLPEARDVVGAERSRAGVRDEDEERDAEPALAVAAAEAEVAPRDDEPAQRYREGQ